MRLPVAANEIAHDSMDSSARITFDAASEADTDRLGAAIAAALPERASIGLTGTLGAGKTRLVQAIAAALGVDRALVVSPTFVLLHEYRGSVPVFHFDAYRLKDDDEFLALGPEEYFNQAGVSLVEWADRVERCMPEDRLNVEIAHVGHAARRFTLSATGPEHAVVVQRLRTQLK
jgi:tRNA threonylcarbamoyladenosine biosynthesis protein TsaE